MLNIMIFDISTIYLLEPRLKGQIKSTNIGSIVYEMNNTQIC